MDTHTLASHLRRSRRPSHLGFGHSKFLDDVNEAKDEALNTAADRAQEYVGGEVEEYVTEATGSETAGQIARAGVDSGISSARGKTPESTSQGYTFPRGIGPKVLNVPLQQRVTALSPEQMNLLKQRAQLRLKPVVLDTNTATQAMVLGEEGQSGDTSAATMSTGKKVAIGVGIAAILIGGGIFLATRKK